MVHCRGLIVVLLIACILQILPVNAIREVKTENRSETEQRVFDLNDIEISINGLPIEDVIGTASGMFADAIEENMDDAINGLNDVFGEFAESFSDDLGKLETMVDSLIEETWITSFCYSHSGSSTSEMYSYEIEADDESSRTVVNYEFYNGFETYTLPTDEELMQQLSAVVDGHNLRKWNGFDKSNSLIMDGSGFYLRIDFSDGTQIMARGSNSYPAGYGEAVEVIDALFLGYLRKNGIDPEWGVS